MEGRRLKLGTALRRGPRSNPSCGCDDIQSEDGGGAAVVKTLLPSLERSEKLLGSVPRPPPCLAATRAASLSLAGHVPGPRARVVHTRHCHPYSWGQRAVDRPKGCLGQVSCDQCAGRLSTYPLESKQLTRIIWTTRPTRRGGFIHGSGDGVICCD